MTKSPPPSSNATTTTTTTPVNGTNTTTNTNTNYAAPHTPIASIKRPRSSLERAPGSSRALKQSASKTGPSKATTTAMSPLHPPKPLETLPETDSTSWMTKAVTDALFSPVLHIWNGKSTSSAEVDENGVEEEDRATVTDDDVCMSDGGIATTTLLSPTASNNVDLDATVPNESSSPGSPASLHLKPSDDLSEFDYQAGFLSPGGGEGDSISDSDEEDEFNPYLFIKSLPPYSLVCSSRPDITLPPLSCTDSCSASTNIKSAIKPLSLVLDLDETLVHCQVDPPATPADLVFPVVFNGTQYTVYVKLRPYLMEFLEKIRAMPYEIIIFTASQKVYAEALLKQIDPDSKYIHHKLFRESCLAVEGNFLKDLTVLGRDLNRTVLVDNSPHAFGYQMDNGIPIESWFEDPDDVELLKLEKFLRQLVDVDDVRSVLREKFKTAERVSNA